MNDERRWHGRYGVLLKSTFLRVPVMHLFAGITPAAWPNRSLDRTVCGLTLADATFMPFVHASKFARRCALCDRAAAREAAA